VAISEEVGVRGRRKATSVGVERWVPSIWERAMSEKKVVIKTGTRSKGTVTVTDSKTGTQTEQSLEDAVAKAIEKKDESNKGA